ncbi:MAG: tetratricopeptide (TPR) repeat protein, partial [Planctomycetota bacterium]
MSESENPTSPPAPKDHVEVLNAQGQRVSITREQYLTQALPEMLKASDTDPERLTQVIMQAVRDGFADNVIAAANRLTVIDKGNLERALTVLAVVQRDSGDLDLAEDTLNELKQRKPDSAAAYVGLGMLQERQGNLDKCEELLLQALEMDSNNPDAVHGYLQTRHRSVGDEGYPAEIEKLMALPGSWRAHMWMARLMLSKDNADGAASIYRDKLSGDEVESDALLMAVADLVQNGKHELIEELIVSRFEPGKHHPHIGMAMLQHYHMQQKHEVGEELLHQMYVHYGHMLSAELQQFSGEFDRLRLSKLPKMPDLPPNPKVNLMRLDRPSWYAGLDDPAWLLPPKGDGHKHIMVFALAIDGQPKLEPAQEEELGRATRSLPLWFAEQIWLSTPHRATAALAMAENGGWAVLGRPWPEEQLASQLPDSERANTILVSGQMRIDGERRRIDLWAYDCATKQRLGHAAAEGAHAEHGSMLLQLMAELWPLIGGPVGHKPQVGDATFWHRYADGMGQHAALVITQTGGLPRDRLYGERFITQWLQNAALAETRWQPAFWLLGSAMCVLQQLGSNVPAEHARLISEVFRQSPADSAFVRLCAKILPACGLLPLWQGRRDEIMAAAAQDADLT